MSAAADEIERVMEMAKHYEAEVGRHIAGGPKYPDIEVRLSGEDGNAYAIMGRVQAALRRAGVPKAEQDAYLAESMSGDYDNLLRTAMKWVDVT